VTVKAEGRINRQRFLLAFYVHALTVTGEIIKGKAEQMSAFLIVRLTPTRRGYESTYHDKTPAGNEDLCEMYP